MMITVALLIVAVGTWAFVFRRRPHTIPSLVALWVILVLILGGYFYIASSLDIGTWDAPVASFGVAGLVALFPVLFLMGMVEVSKLSADAHRKAALRASYAAGVLMLMSLLGVALRYFQQTFGPSPAVTGTAQALGYGGYVTIALGVGALVLNLISIIRYPSAS